MKMSMCGVGVSLSLVLGGVALADDVVLVSGETLTGEIVEKNDQHVVIDHAILGRLDLGADQVRTVNGAALGEAAPDASLPVVETEPESEWKSRFDVGFSAASGNTESQDVNIGVSSLRERELDRTALDASYFFGASNGDRSTNKLTAGVLHDWLIPDSKWFYFAQGRYDLDEFQSWDQRLSAGGGLGYHLIDEEHFDLSLRAGAGVVKEFGSKRNQLIPEGLFGADVDWKINDRQHFVASSTIFPDLDETGEFRALSTAAWVYDLDDESNMSLMFGLLDEYQSKVDAGVEHNDLRVFGGLGFDF